MPVLAELHRLTPTVGGGRFAMLAHRLGVGRDSLARTLDTLINRRRWVVRNPGYGHPLRPEYLLSPKGRSVGRWCGAFLTRLGDGGIDPELAYRKWTMPVLDALANLEGSADHGAAAGGARFTTLRRALRGITPRALVGALKDLHSAGLVQRVIVDEAYPPVSVYRLTDPARCQRLLGRRDGDT